jgi:beta-galactosidase
MEIKLEKEMFVINGKPIYIYSGEIHYWRISIHNWKKHLRKAKEAGLNTVSTYVPWCIHEPEDGKINLEEFIKYCEEVKRAGLYLIARIGPVSNAELVLEGLPKWLSEKHPEIYVKGKDLINLPHATLISYNNPTFLSYVKRWYEKVLPIISQNQVNTEGNIILLQLCNEIGMVHWLNKAIDYSDQSQKMYREYLRKKYIKIDDLNKKYKTNYTEFNEIKLPENVVDENRLGMYIDLIYFCADYYAQYYNFLYNETKKFGITIPVVANIPQFYDYDVRGRGIFSPMTTIMFREYPNYVPEIIFGGAYQMRQLDYENFHDVHITSEVVKMITKKGVPTVCCELQTGILRDRPRLYPQDVELNLKTSCASGLNGLNAYMFSGGKNINDTGAFGSYHEWQAVIDSQGNEREHFVPMKLFGKFIKTFGEKLSQTKKVYDTTIGFYAPYYATELIQGKFVDELELRRNLFFFDGIARLLQISGYNYNLVDIERIPREELENVSHMWLFSLDFVDEKTLSKIVDYIKTGGKIVVGPQISKTFAKNFGLETDFVKENFVYVNEVDYYVMDKIQIYKGDVDEILAVTKKNYPCAVRKKVGSGEVIIYGFGMHHMFDPMIDLVKLFSKKIGINNLINVSNKDICTTLRLEKDFGFLFVFNYHMLEKETNIKFKISGEEIKIPNIKLGLRSGQILPINIKLDDVVIKSSNVEIIDLKTDAKKIFLTANSTSEYHAEIVINFYKPRKIKQVNSNGQKVKFKIKNNTLKLNFLTTKSLQNIEIK